MRKEYKVQLFNNSDDQGKKDISEQITTRNNLGRHLFDLLIAGLKKFDFGGP